MCVSQHSGKEADWWRGMSVMEYIIFNVVITLRWILLLWRQTWHLFI